MRTKPGLVRKGRDGIGQRQGWTRTEVRMVLSGDEDGIVQGRGSNRVEVGAGSVEAGTMIVWLW